MSRSVPRRSGMGDPNEAAGPLATTTGGTERFPDDGLERVWRVLNRTEELHSFEELRNGLDPKRRPALDEGARIAFGFDTSAIYRLGQGKRGADALDYLS